MTPVSLKERTAKVAEAFRGVEFITSNRVVRSDPAVPEVVAVRVAELEGVVHALRAGVDALLGLTERRAKELGPISFVADALDSRVDELCVEWQRLMDAVMDTRKAAQEETGPGHG